MAVGVLRDGSPVIASSGGDGTVRVWRLADGTQLAHPQDLSEPARVVAPAWQHHRHRGRLGHRHPPASRSMTHTKLLPVQRPWPIDTTIG
jgi:hypothetical protein